MQNRLTIKDIARLSGVGKSTVSRVLNNESGVSEWWLLEHAVKNGRYGDKTDQGDENVARFTAPGGKHR